MTPDEADDQRDAAVDLRKTILEWGYRHQHVPERTLSALFLLHAIELSMTLFDEEDVVEIFSQGLCCLRPEGEWLEESE